MITYRGHATDTSSAHVVERLVDGTFVGLLQHHPKHSPTGFSWGYAGSGPADLARSMLIDHLGEAAWCRNCRGQGKLPAVDVYVGDELIDTMTELEAESMASQSPDLVWRPTDRTIQCLDCYGEKTSFGPKLYQQFKFDIVARLPQTGSWTITSDDIASWLQQQLAAS